MLFAAALAVLASVVSAGPGDLEGSPFPHVNPLGWSVWEPPSDFSAHFGAWSDEPPAEMLAWCKAFIPHVNTTGVSEVGDRSVVPIELFSTVPLPGYVGQCAVVDGRGWDPVSPYTGGRPADSRFAGFMKVAGNNVSGGTTCGMSHNVCCSKSGCGSGSYGSVTCSKHCPDEEMKLIGMRCWTAETGWTRDGIDCADVTSTILAAKAYIKGRGGNPCVSPLGVPSPSADWDIGLVLFPTKRRVLITGFVDDAPATECYAQVVDASGSASQVTLAQMPMPSGDIAVVLAGFSDRNLNPSGNIVHISKDLLGHDGDVFV